MIHVIRLKDNEGKISLDGQIHMRTWCAEMPRIKGRCRYDITVITGTIQLNHAAYDPHEGTWFNPLPGGKQPNYLMCAGNNYSIQVEIAENAGKLDYIEIVNCGILKKAEFYYIAILEGEC